MSHTVIKVENLSKKYTIRHQQNGSYTALRDVLADKARMVGNRMLSALCSLRPAPCALPSAHNPSREDFWALKDVSFEVKQGEVIGIIGRNGAGKSTLLKILSRITEPTTGSVKIKGRVASLLEVGTGFHPELTGRENVYLNGAILGMTKAEIKKKFDEIVAFAEIEKFLDTPVKRYSSGMYVRLAFAVAAHLEPEILVIDEVLAVGDAQFQKKCLGKMGEVAKEGRTVIFVSHNMPSVQNLCSRVLLMQKGLLILSNNPDTVISNYLSSGVNIESSEVDLNLHPGRSRSKEPALKQAWCLNKDNTKFNKIMMGESLRICFRFRSSRAIKCPYFGFGIEDGNGRRIFSLNNLMSPIENNSLKPIDSGVACLEIPCVPLLPGTYFVSLSLVEDNNTWVDFVERAIAFQVQPADVYGSGNIPHSTHGVVYVNGHINFNPENFTIKGSYTN